MKPPLRLNVTGSTFGEASVAPSRLALDAEAAGCLTLLLLPPHPGVRRFEVPGEARRIKQRRGGTGKRKPLLEAFQCVPVAAKLKSAGPVVVQRRGNQFGQADGLRRRIEGFYSCPRRLEEERMANSRRVYNIIARAMYCH